MTGPLRIGTRSSALALAQSRQVVALLAGHGVAAVLVPLTTPGDGDRRALSGRGHEGIFVSSVRDAVREGYADVALHSFKDVPTHEAPGLVVAAVPRRADPRDTLVSDAPALSGLAGLPAGARIGTCSVRRAAWVRRVRPDARVLPIRGNVDERIDGVRRGDFDAIVLAAAGLLRLGRAADIAHVIPADSLVPAPAQGALALECRSDDEVTRLRVRRIDHAATRLAAIAERAVLDAIDPPDATAVGALATMRGGRLFLLADISEPDGSGRLLLRASSQLGTEGDARRAGQALARALTTSRMAAAS